METEPLEELAAHLEGMRWGLEQYRSGDRSASPGAIELGARLLDRYDATLRQAADLLDIRDPGITMPEEIARADIEDALVAAGLELKGPLPRGEPRQSEEPPTPPYPTSRPGNDPRAWGDDVLDLRSGDPGAA